MIVRLFPKETSPDVRIQILVLAFLLFSLVGWCWEVLFAFSVEGAFVNRGMLHGPWLPVYGVGGILLLTMLRPLRRKPAVCFLGAVVLSGLLEYGTAWILETCFHLRYWDYSGCWGNIQGRICIPGLLAFGMGEMAMMYVFWPRLDRKLRGLPEGVRRGAAAGLTILFLLDLFWSLFHPNCGDGIAEAVSALNVYPDRGIFAVEPLTNLRFLL